MHVNYWVLSYGTFEIQVLVTFREQIDFFAMEKGYSSVMSDLQYHESDRRQCWSAPKVHMFIHPKSTIYVLNIVL